MLDVLPWSSDSYNTFVGGQDGQNPAFEEKLRALYPPLDNVRETRPSSIVDKYGVTVLYFVPGALKPDRQASRLPATPHKADLHQAQIFMDAEMLNLTFEKNKPGSLASWRLDPGYFRPDTQGLLLSPGLATLGVLQSQGHQVRYRSVLILHCLTMTYSNPARESSFPGTSGAPGAPGHAGRTGLAPSTLRRLRPKQDSGCRRTQHSER